MIETFRSVVRFKPIELDPVKRRLNRAATVDDLRTIARRRLPRGVFDYIDGGAEDERTMARNVGAFGRIEFRPRVLRDVSRIDPSTELFGRRLAFPLILAPTGFTRIAHSQGELAVARAGEPGRHPVLAVDRLDTVDRRRRSRLRRCQVVPGLHLARPGTGPRARRARRPPPGTRRCG